VDGDAPSSLLHTIGDFLYSLSVRRADLYAQALAAGRKKLASGPSGGLASASTANAAEVAGPAADERSGDARHQPATARTKLRFAEAAARLARVDEAVHLLRQKLLQRGVSKEEVQAAVVAAERDARTALKRAEARKEAASERAQQVGQWGMSDLIL
jgi:hypothetical protein